MSTQLLEVTRNRSTVPPGLEPLSANGGSGAGFPIDLATQQKLEALLGRMSDHYRFLPSGISTAAGVRQHAVVKEGFRGDCYQYALCGLSHDQRRELVVPLRDGLQAEGLPLTAVDSGDLLLIHRAKANKGQALEKFAHDLGFKPEEVFKFGDQAGPLGNDRELLRDGRSFNVGQEVAASSGVRNLGRVGPEGVLSTLRWLQSHNLPPRAILSDFDGTLNWGETSAKPQLDLRLARMLVELARSGTQVGIVTGRGETFFKDGLFPLYRAGLDPRAAQNFSVYLFNGARPTTRDEWPPFVPMDRFESGASP